MTRLSLTTCKPAYDPALADIGIVHLGVGAFHRAHQADYTDDAIRRGGHQWGILGASLRSAETRDHVALRLRLRAAAGRDRRPGGLCPGSQARAAAAGS